MESEFFLVLPDMLFERFDLQFNISLNVNPLISLGRQLQHPNPINNQTCNI